MNLKKKQFTFRSTRSLSGIMSLSIEERHSSMIVSKPDNELLLINHSERHLYTDNLIFLNGLLLAIVF